MYTRVTRVAKSDNKLITTILQLLFLVFYSPEVVANFLFVTKNNDSGRSEAEKILEIAFTL